MFCMKCGQQLPDDALFCSRCRAATAINQPAPTPPAEPVSAPTPLASEESFTSASGQEIDCVSENAPILEADSVTDADRTPEPSAFTEDMLVKEDQTIGFGDSEHNEEEPEINTYTIDNTVTEQQEAKSSNSKGIKSLLIAVLLLLSIGFVSVIYCFTPAHKVINALEENNLGEAEKWLGKSETPLQRIILSWTLPSTLDDINDAYNNGDLTEAAVGQMYATTLSYDLKVDVTEQYDCFKGLKESKQAYDTAKAAKQRRDFPTAIENYRKVLITDSLYEASKVELTEATEEYKKKISSSFYSYILKKDTAEAEEILREALLIVSDGTFEKMQKNMKSGFYNKILPLVENSGAWERRTQSSGPKLVCYSVAISQSPKVIRCSYVWESMLEWAQSDYVSVSGPVVWYRYSSDGVKEMDYEDYKSIDSTCKYRYCYWNPKMTKAEKLEAIDKALK